MHVAFLSTYPPTACGLATFTQNLQQNLQGAEASEATGAPPAGGDEGRAGRSGFDSSVVAVTKEATEHPECVMYQVRRDEVRDYAAAAEFLNASGTDVVSLQHEFGIFGGGEGRYVTQLLERLDKPVVTTLHTVLPDPPAPCRRALIAVAAHSDHLVVMSHKARALLQDRYGIAPGRLSIVPHGVPDMPFEAPDLHKDVLDAEGRTVLLTFGLLGPGKGIEFVLEALPAVIETHPEVLYIVLGATHPEVRRHSGESYRHRLEAQVHERGLEAHVRFVNEYVRADTLYDYLRACDLYITPYPGRDQIASGTLAYAVGMGKAIVSTPYLYAEELLAEERGRLVGFEDTEAMRRALTELAGDREARHAMACRAYRFGREMTWPSVGKRYRALFEQVHREQVHREQVHHEGRRASLRPQAQVPRPDETRVNLDHLAALTDDTGIFQHVAYGTPDRRHGYCTDDAGRALVVVLAHYHRHGRTDARALRLARTYLSFLLHAQRGDGTFHNFMSYARCFTDERGSEDTLGRALWGTGAAVAYGTDVSMRVMARQMTEQALQAELHHPRALAYVICGLHLYLRRFPGATGVRRILQDRADQLLDHYEATRAPGWSWFSDALTYANPKMPEALLLAYDVTGAERFREAGVQTLDFLLEETYREGHFDFVGNRGWEERPDRGRSGERATYDQQPVEAGYTAEACVLAYELTGQAVYRERAHAAIAWLFGRNRQGRPLYEPSTGACADGLTPHGRSRNVGAESAVACQLGLLAYQRLAGPRPGASPSDPKLLTDRPPAAANPPPGSKRRSGDGRTS